MTAVTLLFGGTMWHAQSRLAAISARVYDQAYMSTAHIRAAQHALLAISRRVARAETDREQVIRSLDDALENIALAEDEALSGKGRAAVAELHEELTRLKQEAARQERGPGRMRLREVEDKFDHAVELNAGDGFRARRSADQVIAQIGRETWYALGASVLAALGITVILSRTLLRSVGYVLGFATAIADGKLDNKIEFKGPSEIVTLLRALAVMQSSIAHRVQQIRGLITERETCFQAEMRTEHQKLEVALDNMAQGLCMFRDDGQILLANQQFALMFGPPSPNEAIGDRVSGVLREKSVDLTPDHHLAMSHVAALVDGRTVSILQRPMESGGWVATFEDITQQVRAEERIQYLAHNDLLTGLLNRETFKQQVAQLGTGLSDEQILLLLNIGLDRFKTINDTLGHAAGDRLLCIVADRLRHSIRSGDLVARIGGDEFAVASLARNASEGRALSERLKGVLFAPIRIGEHHLAITASFGITTCGREAEQVEHALGQAELALRKAKSAGGSTARFFEPEMDIQLQDRRRLEAELRASIMERNFSNEYQPLVDPRTRLPIGYEALVRWNHPTRGTLHPSDFLSVAEESGLIADIGWLVLRQACRDAAGWDGRLQLAVNISPTQFRDPRLVDFIAGALDSSGLTPTRLELDVTEAILLQNSAGALATLQRLRELGVVIAMDDFGTGFSSLSYLSQFHFDRIKIDRSFVEALEDTAESLAIIRAAISLGGALQMSVVAKGVETEEQLSLVLREGCDLAQGYLFGKPERSPPIEVELSA